VTTLRIGP